MKTQHPQPHAVTQLRTGPGRLTPTQSPGPPASLSGSSWKPSRIDTRSSPQQMRPHQFTQPSLQLHKRYAFVWMKS